MSKLLTGSVYCGKESDPHLIAIQIFIQIAPREVWNLSFCQVKKNVRAKRKRLIESIMFQYNTHLPLPNRFSETQISVHCIRQVNGNGVL